MDTEGGGTGAGMPAQPVRDGLTRLQGTERNTAALPRKGRGGGQKPFSIKQLHCRPRNTFRCTTLFPAPEPEARSRPGTAPGAVCARTTVKLHILNISLNYGMMNYYIFLFFVKQKDKGICSKLLRKNNFLLMFSI